ncbi:MAG: glycosyltransferase [Bacteroidales bacterium]|nr:glycosyltransferase [Bacteroidales bacterium]
MEAKPQTDREIRVLFIASGNTKAGISPIVAKQGESLEKAGLKVDYFPITGKGIKGYLSVIPSIRKKIRSCGCDVVHAHYSFSGFSAALAFAGKPLVVSLMGSDIKMGRFWNRMIRLFSRLFWSATIVKSERMKSDSGLEKAWIIPNGVNLEQFYPFDRNPARQKAGFEMQEKVILFIGNPARPEKNFTLLQEAAKLLPSKDIRVKVLNNAKHEDIPVFMNAADLLALPSLWEGSPNVVKEAMACNLPVVSTDVGDVRDLFGDEPGHFIAVGDPESFAGKIIMALEFNAQYHRTRGRKRISDIGLDTHTVVRKITEVYNNALQNA